MLFRKILNLCFIAFASSCFSLIAKNENLLPDSIKKIMNQPIYQHSSWGLYVKDLETGKTILDLNSDQFFLPASTTKLFSVAALLQAYGDDYRFKTPIFAIGPLKEGQLNGHLILVAQGDLTMGGRQQKGADTLAFTKLDHIIANNVPGVILTEEDPLNGFQALAKQIRDKGIKEINGDVIIDARLFEEIYKREMLLSPLFINENLIDMTFNPTENGQSATLDWRPKTEDYSIKNEVKTVPNGETDIQITSDESGKKIVVKGQIPSDQKNVVRTFLIKDPNSFGRSALIQALRDQGITVNVIDKPSFTLPSEKDLLTQEPLAVWISPPLSEYAKLILKVSHNLGADLIPLLLAIRKGEKTFDEGMVELGKFVIDKVKLSPDTFVFIDAAGSDTNRLTPKAEVQLLEYMSQLPKNQFENFFNALPILGIDGSLADFAKDTEAVGKVRAKTGTGVSFNLATKEFFLTTQTLAGYIEGKNGHLIAFMLAVNNGKMPEIKDVFAIFEDSSQIANAIYESTETKHFQLQKN